MELDKIEKLLVKYEEAETSLAEEKLLQEYFTTQEVPPHLEEFKMMFAYTAKEKVASYSKQVDLGKENKRRSYAFVGIAASIILAVGLFAGLNNGQEELTGSELGTIEDPEEAYLRAKETLQMVSAVLNTGTAELTYLDEFDKAKNKIIKD